MALLDAAYILSTVRSLLNEVSSVIWTDDQLNKWVQEAAIDISTKTLGYEAEDRITTVANTLEYDEPSGAIKVHACMLKPIPPVYACPNSVIDTATFESGTADRPYAYHLGSGYYVVAYRDANNKGQLKTYHVSSSTGAITAIGSLEFDSVSCYCPIIRNVSGTTFAIGYRGPGYDVYVITMPISATGVIGSIIDTYYIATTSLDLEFVHIAGTTYAFLYRGPGGHLYCLTFAIQTDGTLPTDDTYIDYGNILRSGPTDLSPTMLRALKRSANIIVLTCLDGLSTITTVTIEISDAGAITTTTLGEHLFTGYSTWIIEIATGIYAIPYGGADSDGFVNTISVSAAGVIAAIDSLEFDTDHCYRPSIVVSGQGDYYEIAYQGDSVNNDGYVKAVIITSAGALSLGSCSAFEFDTSACTWTFIMAPVGIYLPVFYVGSSDNGILKSMELVAA